ncbi:MAG: SusD/RagB family nutrient-binding outer membrane lipoprotein [Cyclobacteriaceae bacterium]|nr:SusD/RagB family nutrient-binding outer membrane lipoprotein [Cyclobacteriaceae bacterium HetDA_MAG_MS6]
MKNIIKNISTQVVLAIAVLLPFGCENSLEDLNVNPNKPAEANIDLVFTHGANNILYKYGRFTNGDDWDLWAGLWTQTFAGNHATGINYDQYDLRNPDSEWDIWYDGFLDLRYVIENGTELEAWTHVGAAQVITAVGLGSLTSYYGSLPWSEALQGVTNPYPAFDTQEQIYNAIFGLLSDAVTNLGRTPNQALATADFVFGGSAQRWLATAYALEARYRNHFSLKDPNGSATAALTAVDNAKTNGFTSGEADFGYPYSGEGTFLNGYFHLFENNQIVASEAFINALQTDNDPRLRAYWNDENVDEAFVGFVGKPNGYGTDNRSFSPIGPKGFYGKSNSTQPITTHFELLFIEAEAAFRAGQLPRAATALNDAIQAQMDLVTPAAIETLTTEGGDVASYQQSITDYIAAFGSETDATITLAKIMTEKHKAMVCMNGESWVDVRRHDHQFPSWLAIPVRQGEVVPVASEFIQRVLYPQESINTNPDNTPRDITIFNKLWIFNP